MFPERERLVFQYHDGDKDVFADPVVLRRRLIQASNGEIQTILKDAAEPARPVSYGPDGNPVEDDAPEAPDALLVREQAREKRSAAVYAAFKLKPFSEADGGGVTESAAIAILGRFVAFLEGEERPGANSPQ